MSSSRTVDGALLVEIADGRRSRVTPSLMVAPNNTPSASTSATALIAAGQMPDREG